MKTILILLALATSVVAQTLTPSSEGKYETKVYDSSFSTSSKIVIGKDEIEASKAPNMSALLSTKANINITNSAFQPNSLLVRGGDSSQVLIIIDDIPVYDASTIQRSFNLNSVNINSVQRIAVIKGSQSVWYGGQALSAVIRIDTIPRIWKKAVDVSLEGGVDDYREISGDVYQPLTDNSLMIVRGQYQFQNERSPVENSEFKYTKRQDNVEAVYTYQDDVQFTTKLSHSSDRSDRVTGLSFMDFRAADIEGFVISSDSNHFLMSVKNNSVAYKPLLSVGFVETHRTFSQNLNQYSPIEENQEYKSYLIPVRGEMRLLNHESWKWDIGVSFQKEGMLYEEFKVQRAKTSNEMSGAFTRLEWQPRSDISFVAGTRYDTDLHYRDVKTYQVGATFGDFRLEHSTGYKLPSLYQLFSNKGNSGLNPESARTYTISHDKVIDEEWETSVTLFETHIENLIAARGNPLQYYNVGRTITKGVEAAAVYRYTYDQKWTFNVAYQEPRDINTGRWLTRRPLKSGSLIYSKKMDSETLNVEIVGRGERDDTKNSTQTVRLPGYGTISASYIFELSPATAQSFATETLSLYFRGQNLTSHKYEESYGYNNPGLEFFAGFKAGL